MSRNMIKLLFLILFLSLTVSCWADDPESWDLLDEDCSDISDWTDQDLGGGVSEVNPAGQFHFTVSIANDAARRSRDIGSYSNTYTFEIKTYLDNVGTNSGNDSFIFYCDGPIDNPLDLRLQVYFSSDGLFIHDGSTRNEVGINLTQQGAWQTWRFLVTGTTPASATCDVYLQNDGESWSLVGDDIDCSQTDPDLVNGNTWLLLTYQTTPRENHMDYMKIATGLYAPTETTNLKLINNAQLNDCKF